RRMDRRLQGRRAGGLDGATGTGARDQSGDGPSDQRPRPRRIHPADVSVGVGPVNVLDGLSASLSHHPAVALVTLFGAGVVTSLTPCIYPMIPITAGILSGASAGKSSRARTLPVTRGYVPGPHVFSACPR